MKNAQPTKPIININVPQLKKKLDAASLISKVTPEIIIKIVPITTRKDVKLLG